MIGLHPCVIITHRSIYYSFTISTRFINIVATTTLLFSHLPVHSYMSSLFTLHQVQACLPEETWKKTELWQAQQLFSHYLEVLILYANSLKLPDTQKSSDRLMRTMNRNVSVCLSVVVYFHGKWCSAQQPWTSCFSWMDPTVWGRAALRDPSIMPSNCARRWTSGQTRFAFFPFLMLTRN